MAQAMVVKPTEPQAMNMLVNNHEVDIIISNNNNNNNISKNRIQVSNTKKPLFFYLNLAKKYMKQYNEVELSALGMAIPTVVTISEILKASGAAVEKRVVTSTVGSKDENKGRLVQKAKIEIVLERVEKPANSKSSSAESTPGPNSPTDSDSKVDDAAAIA